VTGVIGVYLDGQPLAPVARAIFRTESSCDSDGIHQVLEGLSDGVHINRKSIKVGGHVEEETGGGIELVIYAPSTVFNPGLS
jgi:hypothetical protein